MTAARTVAATSSAGDVASTTIQRSRRAAPFPSRRRPLASSANAPAAPLTASHPPVERRALQLEAVVLAPAHPCLEDLGRSVEEEGQIWPDTPDGPIVDLAQLADEQAASVPLVGQGGVHAAVGDHVTAGAQCRGDDLGEVLGPVRGGEQRLGAVVHRRDLWIVEDGPDPPADGRPTRLPGEHCVERTGQCRRHRALAAPLGPFEGDVPAAHRSEGTRPGSWTPSPFPVVTGCLTQRDFR